MAKSKKQKSKSSGKTEWVVVIDPGHGGNDPGARGASASEKDINLRVAELLRDEVSKRMKNVRTVMTRSSDRYVSLADRCLQANAEDADLFISIHCDSSDNNPDAEGATVFTPLHKRDISSAGKGGADAIDSGQDVAGSGPDSPEESALITASNRLGNLILSRLGSQAERSKRGVRRRDLFVLQFTKMPAVLVELDFICNSTQEAYLRSDKGQKALALAMADALEQYVSTSAPVKRQATPAEAKPTKKSTASAPNKGGSDPVIYKVQFLTSMRPLPEGSPHFKKLAPVDSYKDGNVYKYTFGEARTIREANNILKEVKTLFPDAFVITTRGGERIK